MIDIVYTIRMDALYNIMYNYCTSVVTESTANLLMLSIHNCKIIYICIRCIHITVRSYILFSMNSILYKP